MDLGSKIYAKIIEKSIQKAIKNKMRFWMDLGGLLERFWVYFGSKLGGKLEPSWHQNQKNEGTKTMSKKVMQKVIQNKIRFWMDLGGLLEQFWVDFSSKLGGKLGPSWHPNLKNGGPKTMPKKVTQKGHASSRKFTQHGVVGSL